MAWTASAPYTLLVAGIIRYVIWPQVLEDGGTTHDLRCLRNRRMHNGNVFMAVSELALLGGLQIRWQDIPFGTLLGCFYTLFNWGMANAWGVDKTTEGPQFLYFFSDTTLPGFQPIKCLLALRASCSFSCCSLRRPGQFWTCYRVGYYLLLISCLWLLFVVQSCGFETDSEK